MAIEYPPEVQERIDFLNTYKVNESLEVCHILQMYPEGLAYPDGFFDSQFFTLVLFNTETMEKRTIGGRDGINIEAKRNIVKMVRIFADGSTLVAFKNAVKIGVFQSVSVYEA